MPTLSIRKVQIQRFGDPSVLAVVQGDIADPAAGEAQVEVEVSSVSGADVNQRRGTYPNQPKAPLTPGYSLVGRVVAVGAGVALKPGDRVASLTVYGGQAERVNVPARFLVPVPAGADPAQAVCLVLDYMTAYQMLVRKAGTRRGQRVFVHGVSGAVGRALLDLCRREGIEVLGTASSRNHDALRALGVTPFGYADHGWVAAVQQLGGVDAVFDPLGYESFDRSYAILRRGGVLCGYGFNLHVFDEGPPRSFVLSFLKLFARNLAVWTGKRTTFYGINREAADFNQDLGALLGMLARGELHPAVKAEFPLDQIQEAHRAWHGGSGMGSIVIRVKPA